MITRVTGSVIYPSAVEQPEFTKGADFCTRARFGQPSSWCSTRLDVQAPEAYGATITYDIPLHVTTPALLRELNEAKTRTERFTDVVAVGS